MPVIYDLNNPLNNPREWTDVQRPLFHRRRFQKRINQIVGTTPTGQPILRLEWGPDVYKWELGHLRRRYRCFTHRIDGQPIDVGVPRWVITQRQEPARYLAEWKKHRWQPDPAQTHYVQTKETWPLETAPPDPGTSGEWRISEDGDKLEFWDKRVVLVDVLGEPPPDGWYPHCFTLTEHLDCCAKYGGLGHCWGLYWEPDDRVLDLIREMKAVRDAEPEKYDPRDAMSQQEFDDAWRSARSWNEEMTAREKTELRDKVKDMWRTHGRRIITGDDSDKPRAYSLPTPAGFNQTDGGLYVPAA